MSTVGKLRESPFAYLIIRLLGGYASYVIGRCFGAFIYPYKRLRPSNGYDALSSAMNGLLDQNTYIGPDALYSMLFFALVFFVSYTVFRVKKIFLIIIWALLMGLYFGFMIEGRHAIFIEEHYQALFGIQHQSVIATLGYVVAYFAIMLGLPVAFTYALSRLNRSISGTAVRSGAASS